MWRDSRFEHDSRISGQYEVISHGGRNLYHGRLRIDSPFKIGDYVILDSGERGKVTRIGIRSTRILTRDDVQVTVPNAIMASTKIINESAPNPRHRVRIKIGVAYGSDIDRVENTLQEIARSDTMILSFPEPRVRFREFGDFSLKFELLCWTNNPKDRGLIVHNINTAIDKVLREKQIKVPFPRQDVYLHADSRASKSLRTQN